jgi:TPR repeat protein
MYYKGIGASQSYEKALEWYSKAAAQNDATAQNNLGVLYENGQGVIQSSQKALEWYRKAAAQGNIDAQNNLVEMSKKGFI